MTKYIVSGPKVDLSSCLTGAERIQARQDANNALRDIVEFFASQHPGLVKINPMEGWLGNQVHIETTPALKEELAKVPGIRKISQPLTGEIRAASAPNSSRRQGPAV